MDLKTFEKVERWLLGEAKRISNLKRPDYTIGSQDVLANFKRVSESTHTTSLVVSAIYGKKHEDALMNALANPQQKASEPIIGRFADRLNYLVLQLALLVDEGYVQLPEELDE